MGFFSFISKAINSVVDTVTNTVKAAINDPISTIAKIGAYATGQVWAIPLISGASTLAHGGNIGDALKSAGTAYAATAIAGQVSGGLDSALGTGASAAGAAANAGPSILANIAGNAAGTFVSGGNPLNAILSGGIGAGVGALTSQIPGFADLPVMAQNAIKNAMSSSLSSNLLGGQQPTQANVNSALAAGQAAANTGSYTAANNTGMYQGEQLLAPKLAKIESSGLDAVPGATPPATTGMTSPLNAPMSSILSAPTNTLVNNTPMGNTNNVFGIGNMNNTGNVYGKNSMQNQNDQVPMYAKGGLIQHFANGGNSETNESEHTHTLPKTKK